MTRTTRTCYHNDRHRDGANACAFWRHEDSRIRVAWTRRVRHGNRVRIRQGMDPEFPFKTRGWLTW